MIVVYLMILFATLTAAGIISACAFYRRSETLLMSEQLPASYKAEKIYRLSYRVAIASFLIAIWLGAVLLAANLPQGELQSF